WQTQWKETPAETAAAPSAVWLDLPRSDLYAKINERVVRMFDEGLVEEVRRLSEHPRGMGREARQAFGYKEGLLHLQGQTTRDEAIAEVQLRTRNFAKRQITWFRHLPGCMAVTELTADLWLPKMHKGRDSSLE